VEMSLTLYRGRLDGFPTGTPVLDEVRCWLQTGAAGPPRLRKVLYFCCNPPIRRAKKKPSSIEKGRNLFQDNALKLLSVSFFASLRYEPCPREDLNLHVRKDTRP
jgi:hypothetical protein